MKNTGGLIVSALLGSAVVYVLFKGSEAEAKAPLPDAAPVPTSPDTYWYGGGPGGWVAGAPSNFVPNLPPTALTRPLMVGETVATYWASSSPSANAKAVVMIVGIVDEYVPGKSRYQLKVVAISVIRGAPSMVSQPLPVSGQMLYATREAIVSSP